MDANVVATNETTETPASARRFFRRTLHRNAAVFLGCALLGGAVAHAAPALAYARHISAWNCLPLYYPLATGNFTLMNQFGAGTSLGFYCPFTYDTAFLDSAVNTVRVDTTSVGNQSAVNACYVAYDGSSNGCSAGVLTPAASGYESATVSSSALWKQDPDKKVGSRYTFVATWIGGGGFLNGVYVSN